VTRVHDVGVANMTIDRTWVYQGFSAKINLTVLNKGDFDEDATVTLYYNVTANKIVGAQNVTLPFGQNATIAFMWGTTGVPYCDNYTLTAAAIIPTGSYFADNTQSAGSMTIRILGDMNGDGTVNILDAIILGNAFLSTPGSSNWNPNADINGDGIVNILDAIILGNHFLQHYP
jgi:hypothetical protein